MPLRVLGMGFQALSGSGQQPEHRPSKAIENLDSLSWSSSPQVLCTDTAIYTKSPGRWAVLSVMDWLPTFWQLLPGVLWPMKFPAN